MQNSVYLLCTDMLHSPCKARETTESTIDKAGVGVFNIVAQLHLILDFCTSYCLRNKCSMEIFLGYSTIHVYKVYRIFNIQKEYHHQFLYHMVESKLLNMEVPHEKVQDLLGEPIKAYGVATRRHKSKQVKHMFGKQVA